MTYTRVHTSSQQNGEEIADLNKTRSWWTKTITEQNKLLNPVRRFQSQYPVVRRLAPSSASCRQCVGGARPRPGDALWQAQWNSLHVVGGKLQSVNISSRKSYSNQFFIHAKKIRKVKMTQVMMAPEIHKTDAFIAATGSLSRRATRKSCNERSSES